MIGDVDSYCRQCQKGQQPKLSSPYQAPLTSTTIGKPWQILSIDIFNVPVSASGKCLLIVQDYSTKWAHAIPLPKHKLPSPVDINTIRQALENGSHRHF